MTSILNYIGRMSKIHVIDCIGKCDTYIEPFAGSFNCGINLITDGFKGKTVLNDKDTFVTNFWECVKHDPEKLYDLIKVIYDNYISFSASDLSDFMSIDDTTVYKIKNCDDEVLKFRAAAYQYLYCRYYLKNRVKYDINDKEEFIEASDLLSNTVITNEDYEDILEKYNKGNVFIMMDPPYNLRSVNKFYRNKPSEFEHERLRNILKQSKSRWVCRYNLNDYISSLYRDSNEIYRRNIGTMTEVYYTNITDDIHLIYR